MRLSVAMCDTSVVVRMNGVQGGLPRGADVLKVVDDLQPPPYTPAIVLVRGNKFRLHYALLRQDLKPTYEEHEQYDSDERPRRRQEYCPSQKKRREPHPHTLDFG